MRPARSRLLELLREVRPRRGRHERAAELLVGEGPRHPGGDLLLDLGRADDGAAVLPRPIAPRVLGGPDGGEPVRALTGLLVELMAVVPAGRGIKKRGPSGVLRQDRAEQIPGVRGVHDAELVEHDAEGVDAAQAIRLIGAQHLKDRAGPVGGGELDLHLGLVLRAHERRREVIEEGPAEVVAPVPEDLPAHVVEGGQVEVHARPLEHAEDQEGQAQHGLARPAVHDDDQAPDALFAGDQDLALPRPRAEDRHPDARVGGRGGEGHQGDSANRSIAISGVGVADAEAPTARSREPRQGPSTRGAPATGSRSARAPRMLGVLPVLATAVRPRARRVAAGLATGRGNHLTPRARAIRGGGRGWPVAVA